MTVPWAGRKVNEGSTEWAKPGAESARRIGLFQSEEAAPRSRTTQLSRHRILRRKVRLESATDDAKLKTNGEVTGWRKAGSEKRESCEETRIL
jgi:hypothetical protein